MQSATVRYSPLQSFTDRYSHLQSVTALWVAISRYQPTKRMDIYRDTKGVLLSPFRDVMKIYIAQFLGQVTKEEQTDADLFVDGLERIFGKSKAINSSHPTIVERNTSHYTKTRTTFGFNSSKSARQSHKDVFNELLLEVMQDEQLLASEKEIVRPNVNKS